MKDGLIEKLYRVGEYYLAGFLRGETVTERYAYALVDLFDRVELPPYAGGRLYPCGGAAFYPAGRALSFHYSFPLTFRPEVLQTYGCLTEEERTFIAETVGRYYVCGGEISHRHALGGRGYTHFVPAYPDLLSKGLPGCAKTGADNEFTRLAGEVLLAVGRLVGRIRKLLLASGAPRAAELAEAYAQVPLHPAQSFYEAVVAVNFFYQLDGCDSLGALDRYLEPYYNGEEGAEELLRELFEGVDRARGWSCILGGSGHCTALTALLLEAGRGLASPNLSFKLSEDTPEELFTLALRRVSEGGGMPAFYNEALYIENLKALGVEEKDAREFVLGGCTETMLAGRANCGSIDAGINLPQVLYGVLGKEAQNFEAFYAAYRGAVAEEIESIAAEVRRDKAHKRDEVPQLIRSLLAPSCMRRGKHFNAGGVPYYFSVINVCGLSTAADSLVAVKKLCFEEKAFTQTEVKTFMEHSFQGAEEYARRVRALPKFGNADREADDLACRLARDVFGEIGRQSSAELKFLPACIMFSCYAEIGSRTEASADLRPAGAPLGDSGGAYQGRDTSGVTSLLTSCARLPQEMAQGTWVVNIRLAAGCFQTPNGIQAVKSLIRTYFAAGGMQLQINCVNQEILEEAYRHPELYASLVVRLGGYSDYFVRLDRALQRTFLDRVEHTVSNKEETI